MSWLDDVLQGRKPENLYEVLDCTTFSTADQLATEYRRKVLACHPDLHPQDETARSRFQLLSRAYSVLSDPKERSLYDQWLDSGLLVPYDVWRKDQAEHHPALHWGPSSSVPAIQHGTPPAPPPSSSSSSASSKTLIEQFRSYEI